MRGAPFDEDFRRMVTPRLVGAIQAEAAHILFGSYGFDEAIAEVMTIACRYGAAYLSDDAIVALRGWVVDQISNVLDEELGP